MKLAIGCDEAAFRLKTAIMEHLREKQVDYQDFGAYEGEAVLYPDVAVKVAEAVAAGKFERGILLCGTGIGMSITANKVPGIRAAVCSESVTARFSRLHNDANILAFGARIVGVETAKDMVNVWLNTEFEGGRHQRRVDLIMKIEEE